MRALAIPKAKEVDSLYSFLKKVWNEMAPLTLSVESDAGCAQFILVRKTPLVYLQLPPSLGKYKTY